MVMLILSSESEYILFETQILSDLFYNYTGPCSPTLVLNHSSIFRGTLVDWFRWVLLRSYISKIKLLQTDAFAEDIFKYVHTVQTNLLIFFSRLISFESILSAKMFSFHRYTTCISHGVRLAKIYATKSVDCV